jgi:hypothetical protein
LFGIVTSILRDNCIIKEWYITLFFEFTFGGWVIDKKVNMRVTETKNFLMVLIKGNYHKMGIGLYHSETLNEGGFR